MRSTLFPLLLCAISHHEVSAQELSEVQIEFLPTLRFQSERNASYEIEVDREGLESFEPLTTLFGSGNEVVYLDHSTRSPKSFYRVTESLIDVAPQSLDQVSLTIAQNEGPTLNFIAGRGQDPSLNNGVEFGIFNYQINEEQNGFELDEIGGLIVGGENENNDDLLASFRKWPDQFLGGFYQYQRLDRSSGRIELFGTPRRSVSTTRQAAEDGFIVFEEARLVFGNVTSASPLVLEMNFEGSISNEVVVEGAATLSVPSLPDNDTNTLQDGSTIEIPLNTKARLTNGDQLPFDYSSDYQGTTDSFEGLLAAQPVTFVEESLQFVYSFRARVPEENSPFRESGLFTCSYTDNLADPPTNVTLTGTYTFSETTDPEFFELDLNYNESDAPELFSDGQVLDGVVQMGFGRNPIYARPTASGLKNGSFSLGE